MTERISRTDDGEIDDVTIEDVAMFRLERMDKDAWWVAVYRPDGSRECFWLRRDKKRVECYHESDGPMPS